MAGPHRKRTDEEKAVRMIRTGKQQTGAFGWMLDQGYLRRDPTSKEWVLNDLGQTWLDSWKHRKP